LPLRIVISLSCYERPQETLQRGQVQPRAPPRAVDSKASVLIDKSLTFSPG
jgi:hypothetical protein